MNLLNGNIDLVPLDPDMYLRKSWVLYRWNMCEASFYWTILTTPIDERDRVTDDIADQQSRSPRDIGVLFHKVAKEGWEKVTLEGMYNDPFNTLLKAFNHENKEVQSRLLNFITVEMQRWDMTENKDWYLPYSLEKKYTSDILKAFGTVDRIDRMSESEFAVIDYKTGIMKDKEDLKIELAWYASILNVEHHLPGLVTTGVMIFPNIYELSNFVYFHRLEEEDFARVRVLDATVRQAMIANKYSRTGNVKICRFCDFYGKKCIGPDMSKK
jgi:hypothetical protein